MGIAMDIKIACPECGSERIKTSAEIHSLDDLVGGTCDECGREISKDDVIAQARKFAMDALSDSIGKS